MTYMARRINLTSRLRRNEDSFPECSKRVVAQLHPKAQIRQRIVLMEQNLNRFESDLKVAIWSFFSVRASIYLHGSQCHASTWKWYLLGKLSIWLTSMSVQWSHLCQLKIKGVVNLSVTSVLTKIFTIRKKVLGAVKVLCKLIVTTKYEHKLIVTTKYDHWLLMSIENQGGYLSP